MPESIERFTGEHGFLSNAYPIPIVVDMGGDPYPTVVHAYHALKTDDPSERARIRTAPTAHDAWRLGRAVGLRSDWDARRLGIMVNLLRLKFENTDLANRILATGDAVLVDTNDHNDTFWGVDSSSKQGQNVTGRLLGVVREELQREEPAPLVAVLDADAFRSKDTSSFEKLRTLGVKLRVSLLAINEAWASAFGHGDKVERQTKPSTLFDPIQALAPFIDPDAPIALGGADLTVLFGGVIPQLSLPVAGEHLRWATELWSKLVGASPAMQSRIVEAGGPKAVADVRAIRASFRSNLTQSMAEIGKLPPQSHPKKVDELAEFFATRGDMKAPVPHRALERFNAYHRSYARLYVRASSDTKYGNGKDRLHDTQDIGSLMHIGQPAFLATLDRGLVKRVDESQSFQAPWVRNLRELAEGRDVPRCLPWGQAARASASGWVRPTTPS